MDIFLTQYSLVVKNVLDIEFQFGSGAFTVASEAHRKISAEYIFALCGIGLELISNFCTGCDGCCKIDRRITLAANQNNFCVDKENFILGRSTYFKLFATDQIRYIVIVKS